MTISPFQRSNLEKLAAYLDTLPVDYDKLDMSGFAVSDLVTEIELGDFSPKVLHQCGTAACAAGHGPSAGIRINRTLDGSWHNYTERAFGATDFDDLWDRCFDGDLGGNHIDAAARIHTWLAENPA